jgi:hypothetical protein
MLLGLDKRNKKPITSFGPDTSFKKSHNLLQPMISGLKFLLGIYALEAKHIKAGEPPLVGCPRLLIQYIRSYPPYLQAVPPTAT